MENMTALVSCFARCYHTINNEIKIYDDMYAKALLSKEEYEMIAVNMTQGIGFFNPNYVGEDPLKWIVNHQLAPSVLARSIMAEDYLNKAIANGCNQYVILASGYDTSAYKLKNQIKVYELDKKEMIVDKIRRIQRADINFSNVTYIESDFNTHWIDSLLNSDFNSEASTFVSCLGISYYLEKHVFNELIKVISTHISEGSSIVFDYPNMSVSTKEVINQKMARAAHEKMQATYSFDEISEIAKQHSMIIQKHNNHQDIDHTYFVKYNKANPNNEIHCPEGVSYCLLTKKGNSVSHISI